MVCFSDDSQAQYYYLRHRRNIALMPPQGAVDPRDKPQAIAQAWKTGDFRLDETVPGPNGESRISGRWMLQARLDPAARQPDGVSHSGFQPKYSSFWGLFW